MHKLEKRFNYQNLLETLSIQFMSARQNQLEKLEDWSDRVLSLECKAYRDLPDSYMYTQAICKICQGCADKDVGQHAATAKPSSVETAIDHIKWYQHNHTAIFGKPTNRCESSRDDDYDVDLTTQAVTKTETKKTDMQTVSQHIELLMDKITAMETTHRKELESIRSEIKRQQIPIQQMDRGYQSEQQMQKPRFNRYSDNRQSWRSNSQSYQNLRRQDEQKPFYWKRSGPIPLEILANLECYFCHKKGHIQRACPDLIGKTNEVPDIVNRTDSLNKKGSG
jgi:hypothetical protein